MQSIRPTKMIHFLKHTIENTKLPVMMVGDPGIGKSDIVRNIADFYNLELIDVRLSMYEPVDLSGLPNFIKKGGKDVASYIPFDIFPTENTELPSIFKKDKNGVYTRDAKGKKIPERNKKGEILKRAGFLLFLDEFNSAGLDVQAASYKLILEKEVGQIPLHPNTIIICAGNKMENNAIVNRLSTAMQSRLIHLELKQHIDDWLSWAGSNNIDHRIKAYLGHKPEYLHLLDPDHNDVTFACPQHSGIHTRNCMSKAV